LNTIIGWLKKPWIWAGLALALLAGWLRTLTRPPRMLPPPPPPGPGLRTKAKAHDAEADKVKAGALAEANARLANPSPTTADVAELQADLEAFRRKR
jgi:hypothetical protein